MDFTTLIDEMRKAKSYLVGLPDDEEWTMKQLADLDDVRMEALRLANEAEATIQIFNGYKSSKTK